MRPTLLRLGALACLVLVARAMLRRPSAEVRLLAPPRVRGRRPRRRAAQPASDAPARP
jgi:hypothetical protein